MKKNDKKDFQPDLIMGPDYLFEATLENFKRRRALLHASPVDMHSKLFFERILQVKKVKELLFCGRAR